MSNGIFYINLDFPESSKMRKKALVTFRNYGPEVENDEKDFENFVNSFKIACKTLQVNSNLNLIFIYILILQIFYFLREN